MTKVLVVSDSSSLILATKAGFLDVVCREFAVIVPEEVFEETVTAGKSLSRVDALVIEAAIDNKKISVRKVRPAKDRKSLKRLQEFALDEGELKAIQLYIQASARLLLVDDRRAINAAKVLGLKWTTIPTMLVGFAKNGLVSRGAALEALRILQLEGRYKLDFILDAFNSLEKINKKTEREKNGNRTDIGKVAKGSHGGSRGKGLR